MRTYAAIYLSIANDRDFQSLNFREQHMYYTLLRQQKLNRAGLLDLNIFRWAKSAADMTEEHVIESLAVLAQRRYVVIDTHTRELLVRTYVRNDGAYKMPRVMVSVVSAAQEIESPRLRQALLAEVDRIPLDELSDEPAKNGGPSIRARVLGYVLQLRKILEDGSPDGPEGIDTPDDTPLVVRLRGIAGLTDTPADTHNDTQSHPSGTYACARIAPEPEPEPNPLPADALFEVEVAPKEAAGKPQQAAGKARASTKTTKPVDPEVDARNKLAVRLAREWYDAQSPKPTGKFVAYQQIVYRLLDADHDPEAVAEALRRCGFALTLPTAEFKLKKIQEERERVVVPFQRRDSDLGTEAHMERFRARQDGLAAAAGRPAVQLTREEFPWNRTSSN